MAMKKRKKKKREVMPPVPQWEHVEKPQWMPPPEPEPDVGAAIKDVIDALKSLPDERKRFVLRVASAYCGFLADFP